MNKYLPKMYQKDIFQIDYSLLKKEGITCLVFDLDNTVATVLEKEPTKEIQKLFTRLKKDFKVILLSNSFPYRVRPFGKVLEVETYPLAMKPWERSLRKIMKKNKLEKEQIALIGDQFMTDMALGNKVGVLTIFVDSLSKKDYKITSFNRYREQKIMNKYQQQKLFEKGMYYGTRKIL